MVRGAGTHGAVMLMYHSVAPGSGAPDWPWAVSAQRFREQLAFLADEGWSTPTVSEFVADPSRWHARTVLVTFDDGYVDNLPALEEMHRHAMRATCYVVAASIGERPCWPSLGRPALRLLDRTELRTIHGMGMEIGSHSLTHARLPALSDAALANELSASKAAIEDHVGSACSAFAYPYGAHDFRCVEAVRHAGYASACTSRSGFAFRDGDPYRLRRVTVRNTDTAGIVARKLVFGDNEVGWTRMLRYALDRTRGG